MIYLKSINNSFKELVTKFTSLGGRVNKYYLQDANKNKHATVFFNGWISGKNIREVINKALAK